MSSKRNAEADSTTRNTRQKIEKVGKSEINAPAALFLGTATIILLLVANTKIALGIWTLFMERGNFTTDVIANLTYLAVAVTCTLIVDPEALVEMHSWNRVSGFWRNLNFALLDTGSWERTISCLTMAVNWAAGHGVLLSDFKIGMISPAGPSIPEVHPETISDVVSGGLDFIPLVRMYKLDHQGMYKWEAAYGTVCGLYLMCIFIVLAAHRVNFKSRQLASQAAIYAAILCYLMVLAGLFKAIVSASSCWAGGCGRLVAIVLVSGVVNGLTVLLWPGSDAQTSRSLDLKAADHDYTKRKNLGQSACEMAPATGKKYLVIGVGSLGGFIMETLLERGDKNVKGFDFAAPKRPLPAGVEMVKGSITDYASLRAACEGVDVVYTTVALIRYYERLPWQYAASHAVNVVGTANIVKACIECGVRMLIQTSSSNVSLNLETLGMEMDEDSPYVTAETTLNHYCWSKAQAEKIVIDANGTPLANGSRLVTGILRPCSAVFGPNDGFLAEKTMTDGVSVMLTPSSKVDYVYVENVAWGHILLEKGLWDNPGRIGGLPFCVSNNDPLFQADLFNMLCTFCNASLPRKTIAVRMPQNLFIVLGWIFETYQRVTRKRVPGILAQLTPATYQVASLSYGFSSKKAHDLLGYTPLYTVEEGCQKTVAIWYDLYRK